MAVGACLVKQVLLGKLLRAVFEDCVCWCCCGSVLLLLLMAGLSRWTPREPPSRVSPSSLLEALSEAEGEAERSAAKTFFVEFRAAEGEDFALPLLRMMGREGEGWGSVVALGAALTGCSNCCWLVENCLRSGEAV